MAAQISAADVVAKAKKILAGQPATVKVKLSATIYPDSCLVISNVPFPCPLCGVTVNGRHECDRKGAA